MRVVKVIFSLALAILLQFSESSPSSSGGNHIPRPADGVLPSRFFYAEGTIHDRDRPNTRPFIEDSYLLGMEDPSYLYPLFNDNPFRVYSFRSHQLIEITNEQRNRLLQGRPLEPSRTGRPPRPPPQASVNISFHEPAAFTGLPAQYVFTNGVLHEYGRPNTRSLIIQNYFFGMVDNEGFIYPVDSSDPYHVYSLIARTMVRITPEVRRHLFEGFH